MQSLITGVQADLSVHNPSVSNHQFSAGGVHIRSVTEAINQTDSIQTGWMVSDILNIYISCLIKRLTNQLALLVSSTLIFFGFYFLSFIYTRQLTIYRYTHRYLATLKLMHMLNGL